MSHLGRQQQQRPDSRSSNAGGGGGGRFTHALSAAIKREDFGRPPLPPTALGGQSRQHQPEEQLEEIEQKITLALQAIDANFDHCQRTMARDVMPKVERLAKLSNELLQASQPWLQFFMAVAAGDDDSGEAQGGIAGLGTVTHAEDIVGQAKDEEAVQMGAAKRAAAAEKAHLGDITARFPDDDDEDASADIDVDIDADIATPQLTSRYMTQEISGAGVGASGGRKRAGEAAAGVSARKRRNVRGTPVAMMRALVGGAVRAGVGFRGVPGSGASHLSGNSSSMGTDDLMPNTSPPHTTTFTLPRSRRIAPAAAAADEEDDDEILGEINSLIKRYDSPRSQAWRPASVASSSSAGGMGGSGAMSALALKYASPGGRDGVRGLVADMEEMLEEAADADDDMPSPPRLASDAIASVKDEGESAPDPDDLVSPLALGRGGGSSADPDDYVSPLAMARGGVARFHRLGADDPDDPFGPGDARGEEEEEEGEGDASCLTLDSAAPASMDGTTTVLPTREMLQHAAAQAAEGEARGESSDDDDDDDDGSGGGACFDVDAFPAAFRVAPASLQLRALYDLLLARGAEECAVDELMAASPELAAASPAAVAVLLDLLVRRRLARRVADGRWAARPPAASS